MLQMRCPRPGQVCPSHFSIAKLLNKLKVAWRYRACNSSSSIVIAPSQMQEDLTLSSTSWPHATAWMVSTGFRPDCRPGDKELRAQIACKQHSAQRVSERCLKKTLRIVPCFASRARTSRQAEAAKSRKIVLAPDMERQHLPDAFAPQQPATNSSSLPLSVPPLPLSLP